MTYSALRRRFTVLACALAVLVSTGIAGAPAHSQLVVSPPHGAGPTGAVVGKEALTANTLLPAAATAAPRAEVDGQSATYAEVSAKLNLLAVKGRAPKTGYERTEFGAAWADEDRNGCDTRNDILRRDLTDKKYKANTQGCVVATGTFKDPYTATTISFERAVNASTVQIDHVVALHDAWQKGAQQLTKSERTAFANDPLNLRASDGGANQQKGSSDAATWLPHNKGFRCEYVAAQVDVKAKYGLWITAAEKIAIAQILASCRDDLPLLRAVPAPAKQTAKNTVSDADSSSKDKASSSTSGESSKAESSKAESSKAESSTSDSAKKSSSSVSPDGLPPASKTECPAEAPIKGNQGSNGWKFHNPGGRWYNNTHPERCFATDEDAAAAGYEKAKNQ